MRVFVQSYAFIVNLKNKKYSYLCLRMARIVHINTVADTFTGVGSVMASLAACQRRQGLEVSIVAGYVRPEFGTFADYIMCGRLRHTLAALEARVRANDGRLCRHATRRLTAWLDSLDDIAALHLHNMHGYYIDMPTLISWARQHRARTVVTLHDQWWCTGRCAYIHSGCNGDCRQCSFKDAYPATWRGDGGDTASERIRRQDLARAMADTLASFVAPSQGLADLASKRLGINVQVIPNGVDTAIFNPDNNDTKTDPLHIVAAAATWTPSKGGQILNAIARSLPKDWRLTVIGRGAPVTASEHINVIDSVTPSNLASIFRSANVFLSTATAEAFGMTVAEALACGIPAVVNAATVTSELIVDGVNGFAVPMDISRPRDILIALEQAAALRSIHTPTTLTADNMADAYKILYFDR